MQARQTAAERVKAALAAKVEALTSGVEAAMEAYARREQLRAEAEKADDELRAAVELLVQADQRLDDIATLTDVPIEDVRACRRPKGSGEVEAPAAPVETARRPRGRQIAVPAVVPPPVRPAFLGDGTGDGQQDEPAAGGADQGDGVAADLAAAG